MRTLFKLPLLCILLGLAIVGSGCSFGGGSSTAPVGGSKQRGTKPYTIRGKTYYPLLSADNFRETGIASWYGRDFHGKLTANGERYDMYGMTAAHKILPFGTQVKVTNKNNGRSIVVRVNDRGPFVANRVIDLTRTGAERLGMIATGTAPVTLESVGGVRGMRDGNLEGRFYVQVGAFGNKANAEGLASRMRNSGTPARIVYAEDSGFWRVQAGPYPSLNAAENAGEGMQSEFAGNFIVAD